MSESARDVVNPYDFRPPARAGDRLATPSEWAAEGTDPGRWRVPPDGPEERRLAERVVGARGAEVFALALGEERTLLEAGATIALSAQFPVTCRVLALVIDEPPGLVVFGVRVGRAELALHAGPVPASLFSATTCSECRDRACQALAGKRWPRVWAGQTASVHVRNDSVAVRAVRAVIVCAEEPARIDEGPEGEPR